MAELKFRILQSYVADTDINSSDPYHPGEIFSSPLSAKSEQISNTVTALKKRWRCMWPCPEISMILCVKMQEVAVLHAKG